MRLACGPAFELKFPSVSSHSLELGAFFETSMRARPQAEILILCRLKQNIDIDKAFFWGKILKLLYARQGLYSSIRFSSKALFMNYKLSLELKGVL